MMKTIAALSFGIGLSYLASWTLRDFFRMAHGPLLQFKKGVHHENNKQALLSMAFRIVIFYSLVVTLISFGNAGLITLFGGESSLAYPSLLAAFFLVAVARLTALSYSGFLLRSIYGVTLGVIGAIGYQLIINHNYVHDIVSNVSGNDLVRLYGLGVLCIPSVTEGFWLLSQKFSGKSKRINYSLFREFDEGYEQHDLAAYRNPMVDLFSDIAERTILESGIKYLYWKTWSGEPKIANAIITNLSKYISSRHSDLPWYEMTETDKDKYKEKARRELRKMENAGKAYVIMPIDAGSEDAHLKVEESLGIKVIRVPDVGNRRYLVINRRRAIISMPVPADFAFEDGRTISECGSNIGIATSNPSRVHHCIRDFESLIETYKSK